MHLGWFIATPAAFLLPSKSLHINAGKLILIGLPVTALFLFAGTYFFPGGAIHFTAYADALLHGGKLHPSIGQRDIGYPFLLLLGGYTIWDSFIGVTLIQAAFSLLMPVLVYWSLVRTSPSAGFYAGIFSIVTIAPVYFLKTIHHDQAYIFFTVLVIALLANFLQSRQHGYLYAFTFAALAASFTRPAGNLLFPVLLAFSYVTVRGRVVHYLSCALIFAAAVGLYQWHRYEIFDMRNQPSIPSYSGQQTFYSFYINSAELGVRLSPDLGPTLQQITEMLRQKLQPSVRESAYMRPVLAELPPAFSEEHLLPFTPDQLIERIYSAPNYEYYMLLASADPDDQHYLRASWEIARLHPSYAARYALRNLWHLLFDPGYAHTRQNAHGFHQIALQFMPLAGYVVAENNIAPRAAREVKYVPLHDQPFKVQRAVGRVLEFWGAHFHDFVRYTSVLMIVAWIGTLLRFLCLATARARMCKAFAAPAIGGIASSIIVASIFLLYNTSIAALFAEPDFRYFHFTELLRIIIAGFAVALVIRLIFSYESRAGVSWQSSAAYRRTAEVFAKLRSHDVIEQYFGSRPLQWAILLSIMTAATFAWWSASIIHRLW